MAGWGDQPWGSSRWGGEVLGEILVDAPYCRPRVILDAPVLLPAFVTGKGVAALPTTVSRGLVQPRVDVAAGVNTGRATVEL